MPLSIDYEAPPDAYPEIEQPTPHAEAYIASPLAAGDGKYKHSEGASGCLNLI